MDCSMPGLPVLHHLLELVQTHVHWVSDAIQPSHPCRPLLLPSIFPSIGVFSIEWAVVWAFFGIAFLWNWNENWPFPVLLSFPNMLAYWVQHFHSIIFYGMIMSTKSNKVLMKGCCWIVKDAGIIGLWRRGIQSGASDEALLLRAFV